LCLQQSRCDREEQAGNDSGVKW